jgi:hypothetical protein
MVSLDLSAECDVKGCSDGEEDHTRGGRQVAAGQGTEQG